MKKLYLLLMLVMFISLTSATSIGTYELHKEVQLYQTCNNCTSCNLTTIKYPNSTNIITNVEMTADETYYYYNLLGGNLTELGTYKYCYECGNAAESETGCVDFDVNGAGYELNGSRVALMFGGLLLLIILFIINLVVIPMLPSSNNYDEDDVLVSINQLKYLRPVLIMTAWFLMIGILFAASNLLFAYMGTTLLAETLFTFFKIMLGLSLPGVVLWFVYIFYSIFQDKKVKGYIERGVEFYK